MKKRSDKKIEELEDIINSGKAQTQLKSKKDGRGRPKSTVKKKQSAFLLPLGLIDLIDANCGGNKSVFAETVFTEFFEKQGLEWE